MPPKRGAGGGAKPKAPPAWDSDAELDAADLAISSSGDEGSGDEGSGDEGSQDEPGSDSDSDGGDPDGVADALRDYSAALRRDGASSSDEEDAEAGGGAAPPGGPEGGGAPPHDDPASDSSEDERPNRNTIGDVPLVWYKDEEHVGYDADGQRIARSGRRDALARHLARADSAAEWRTVYDEYNDEEIVLSKEEMRMIHRIRRGQFPHVEVNPYPEEDDWFSRETEVMPLSGAPEPKRRFVPSKWEEQKVVKLVRALRRGWLKRAGPEAKPEVYMLWEDDGAPAAVVSVVSSSAAVVSAPPRRDRGPPEYAPPQAVRLHRRRLRPLQAVAHPALTSWLAGCPLDLAAGKVAEKTATGLSYIPAPKLKLPGHEESYNPPKEYLPSEEERAAAEAADPEDAPAFLPRAYDSLRLVPAYASFVKERFERCLDLYLCPRTRVKRLTVDGEWRAEPAPAPAPAPPNQPAPFLRPFSPPLPHPFISLLFSSLPADPESLVPKLPRPRDLQPFPTLLSLRFTGHTAPVASLAPHPSGQWLLSGAADGGVRLWEVRTGRCLRAWQLGEPVTCVAWCPDPRLALAAAAAGKRVALLPTGTGDEAAAAATGGALEAAVAAAEGGAAAAPAGAAPAAAVWRRREGGAEAGAEAGAELELRFPVRHLAWHARGDYFSTTAPAGNTQAVLVHQLSRGASQNPFRKNRGRVVAAAFHPTKLFFFVATQQAVRVYNLAKQALARKLLGGSGVITCLDVHPSGDHLIVGGEDKRLAWYDLDLSARPYRALRYHTRAVRAAAFHRSYPLFASASDDGAAHVFHGMVYADLMTNPLIVPVKILRGHGGAAVAAVAFHPTQPWVFTGGADAEICLFVNP
jgi:ribosome biogenesis protein ERB1